ncbi:MAG: TatD family hydrolase [Deltaproteobacteria bacterium]|nr:TatD family hydrolase [Deltaproteobacteria bacterium]
MFIDSHAHLDGSKFESDLDETLLRAQEAGVTHIICIGASDGRDSNPRTLALAERYDHIFATVGIHPHDASLADDATLAAIEAMAKHEKVVGIGETGLDYHYNLSPKDAQIEAFRRFLRMAKALDLACIVHTREAEEDTLRILREERASELRGVFHCFTGSPELARAAIDLGWHISFSGVLTFRNADALREIARELPKDRVLVETDCPYLAPVPHRGRRNEPAFVLRTAEALAEAWGEELATVSRFTVENTVRLFRLPIAG